MITQDFLKAVADEHKVSKGELEVLSLAMKGQSTAAIAESIGISGDAVRKRLSEVYQKFQIAGRGPVKLTKLQQLLVTQYQAHMASHGGFANNYLPSSNNSTTQRYADWGEAPDVSVFYGRTEELKTLEQWIIKDSCRLVALLGMKGIGKTALSVKIAKKVASKFSCVVWRSLRQAPAIEDFLGELIQVLTPETEKVIPETKEERLAWLIEHFRTSRCLVILDNIGSILRSGDLAGTYEEGYEDYGLLLKKVGGEPHQSCLLVTCQEKLNEISLLEGETSPVRSLKLDGLGEAARQILKEKGLSGEKNWVHLIKGYRGNPLMLKLVAMTIKEVFDGDVTDFLSTTLFTHDVSDFIEEMLDRLSELENQLICQMATKKKPISVAELQTSLADVSPQNLLQALASLRQRSLIEKVKDGFTLPPAVMEVTAQIMTES
ncbi:MAG: NB-ARC domain-containing protein [Spirulinaceae cyanobacterium]